MIIDHSKKEGPDNDDVDDESMNEFCEKIMRLFISTPSLLPSSKKSSLKEKNIYMFLRLFTVLQNSNLP